MSVPTASGPLSRLAHLAIKTPATVPPGPSASVSATVTSRSDAPRVITTPSTSAVLVVRSGRVVAQARGAASAPPVPLQLSAGATLPAQAIPASVRLVGCGTEPTALAAGRYTVIAVLGYESDTLNAAPAGGTAAAPAGERSFVLVSNPEPITVG